MNQLAQIICTKLKRYPGVCFADIAQKATECELNQLATLVRVFKSQINGQFAFVATRK